MSVPKSLIVPVAGVLCWACLALAATCGGSGDDPTPTPVPDSPTTAATAPTAPADSVQATATRAASSPSPSAATATTAGATATTPASPTKPPPTAAPTKPVVTVTPPPPTATTVPSTATPTATPQPTATPTPAPFRITGVNYPSSVVSGGAKGSLTVTWSGQPKFPVTIVYQMYSCPPDTNCVDPVMTFNSAANPLVFPESVWCIGFTKTVQFGYRVILIDADDKATNAWDAPFTCTPP